ncbi:ABC transporter ATP-binding protein [Cellulosilyticum ruminicola]|uniref:ABC transporter ATP-binding protein n=1 Tax=Cellulosilyticum ruminicola TaxID=425254 RepID=UPI00155DD12A|nr:ABC transporter ATP-binding protein [Cellulosilyticum ruminicola]
MIKIADLTFNVLEGNKKRQILNIPNYVFDEGKINVICGPSGSGKTTLLYALGGILEISSGTVTISGTSVYSLKQQERDHFRMKHISMIYQNFNLFSFMTVEENILAPYFIRGLKVDQKVKQKVADYLKLMNLGKIQNKSISALSGGEQQRVAIIRSMILKPSVILCDEPTASLDSENTIRFMQSLIALNNEKPTTVIIATHDEKVMRFAENKIQMVDGKIMK